MSKVGEEINKYHNKVLIAVGVLIVLMAIFLLYRLTQNNQPSTQETPIVSPENVKLFGDVIELQDQKTLSIGSTTITMPDGWTISTAYQNSDNAKFKCNTDSVTNCRIFSVTDGSQFFYISTPAYVRDTTSNPVVVNVTKKLNIGDQDVDFIYEKLNLVKKEDNAENTESTPITDQDNYFQLYGCMGSNICLSSLSLDLDLTTNKTQVAAFESLATNLKVD